jgi:hypothetical protein
MTFPVAAAVAVALELTTMCDVLEAAVEFADRRHEGRIEFVVVHIDRDNDSHLGRILQYFSASLDLDIAWVELILLLVRIDRQ